MLTRSYNYFTKEILTFVSLYMYAEHSTMNVFCFWCGSGLESRVVFETFWFELGMVCVLLLGRILKRSYMYMYPKKERTKITENVKNPKKLNLLYSGISTTNRAFIPGLIVTALTWN